MAIIKAVNSRATVGRAINYITQNEKTQDRIVSGLNCDPTRAVDDMKATKQLYNKLDGRQYKHYIQSFAEGEAVTAEQVHKMGVELAKKQFEGFEVVVATHTDKGHLHNHFIVNSVSFEDGHKFRQDKRWLQKMKDRSDDLCREQGLTICERGRTFDGQAREDMTAWNKDKYNLLERADQGKVKSYVLDTALAVMQSREQSTSRADFIQKMSERGYTTTWEENKKHIVFQNEQGQKVRASNIEKTFKIELNKEGLEREFSQNAQRNQEREQYREQLDFARTIGNDRPADTDNISSEIREREQRLLNSEIKYREQSFDRAVGEISRQNEADKRKRELERKRERERERERTRDRSYGGYER